ncbi:MAG: Gfo/Idh/MocA family oxidoreductase [Prolixibacteraceae bacterium]|nr:Gfo/Idh/MocA family oxidoreductase [Prolixibacteraceae bacterium]
MTKRRDFIKKSVIGTAAISIGGIGMTSKSYASILGANERINVAVIGIRGQGRSHINSYCTLNKTKNVRLKTLCDVDEELFAERIKTVVDKIGEKPLTEWDMRKVLDDKEIDAVSFATPNHWHALGTIWACQAGKHVYVEKPACHNISEGRKMTEAARKYNLRVQVGFNNRSNNNVRTAIKFLHDGGIGDVYMARGLCVKPRDSFGIAKDSEPPASLHYDLWLGPATWRRFNEKRHHYNWHWFWDTGNGDTGNQGPHQFDVARWGLNKNEHPVSAYSTGGVYGIDPDECAQETPNTQASLFKYADGKMLEFETRGRYSNGESSLEVRVGNLFYGTDGYLEINGGTWKAFRQRETEPFAGSEKGTDGQADLTTLTSTGPAAHWANFLDAIRSGNSDDLNCEILDGHYSSALSHLGNISYRLGRELKFMGEYEKFANDPEADTMLTRKYRYPYILNDEI